MNAINQKFRNIDDLLLQVGNYLIRNDRTIAINTIFDKLLRIVDSIQVSSNYLVEKQKRIEYFTQFWNSTKALINKMPEVNNETYTIVLQSMVEIYLWLMDIRNT